MRHLPTWLDASFLLPHLHWALHKGRLWSALTSLVSEWHSVFISCFLRKKQENQKLDKGRKSRTPPPRCYPHTLATPTSYLFLLAPLTAPTCSSPHFSTTRLWLLLGGLDLLTAHYWAMERKQWSIYTVIEDMRASYSSTVQQGVVQLAPAHVEWNQVSRAPSQADHWNIYQGLHCWFQRPVLRSLPELPCHCHSNQINWQKFRHNRTRCNSTYSYIHKGERETATCTA